MLSAIHQPWSHHPWTAPPTSYGRHPLHRPSMPSPLSDPAHSPRTPTTSTFRTPTAHRTTTVPASQSPRDTPLARQRRGQFLRKVRERRDEERWSGRAEEISRLDRAEWVRERRREEERALREAPVAEEEMEDDHDEEMRVGDVANGHGGEQGSVDPPRGDRLDDQALVEDLMRLEEKEVDALVEMMEHGTDWSSAYGSDDDDEYDVLFEQMLSGTELHEDASRPGALIEPTHNDDDKMDMDG